MVAREKTQARQGATGHNVRYMLGGSLALAVVAVVVALVVV